MYSLRRLFFVKKCIGLFNISHWYYLKYLVEKLAELKSKSAAEIAFATTINAEKIFGKF
jgi:hypothetical protein